MAIKVERIETILTRRQHQIALLLVQKKSNEAICKELGIEKNTLRNHLKNLYITYGLEEEADRRRLVAESYVKYIGEKLRW